MVGLGGKGKELEGLFQKSVITNWLRNARSGLTDTLQKDNTLFKLFDFNWEIRLTAFSK